MLLVAFLFVNAPNYHLFLVLASVVQGDAVNCNRGTDFKWGAGTTGPPLAMALTIVFLIGV